MEKNNFEDELMRRKRTTSAFKSFFVREQVLRRFRLDFQKKTISYESRN